MDGRPNRLPPVAKKMVLSSYFCHNSMPTPIQQRSKAKPPMEFYRGVSESVMKILVNYRDVDLCLSGSGSLNPIFYCQEPFSKGIKDFIGMPKP